MNILEEIRNSKKNHKKVVADIAGEIKKDKKLFADLVEGLETGSDVEKGTVAEIMKYVTAEKPEYAISYLDKIIKYINCPAPRVKWGVPESIGHIARKFPKQVEKAVPLLLQNAKDASTVIRWCAAFALCEIVKYNTKIQKTLLSKIKEMVKKEQNRGVKNIYLKALKSINK